MSDVNTLDSVPVSPAPEAVLETVSDSSMATSCTASAASWKVITAKSRVDSFNQDALMEEIKAARENGQRRIALDLRNNRFLSFPVIRFCVDTAREIADEGGAFALIGCAQKTKRHFEIYGSLAHIQVVRKESELSESKTPRDL